MTRYLAFDIETAKDVPGPGFHWKPHRPLGISCIASAASNDEEPRLWYSTTKDGLPASQLSKADLCRFIDYLIEECDKGASILTWNGLAFDFDILAEESERHEECEQLAMQHIDMMFHIVCVKGFRVSLAAAAEGLNLPGKLAGVAGIDAPSLWAEGEHQKVLDYVSQDVQMTLGVAETSQHLRKFIWRTKRGSLSTMPLQQGWLTVHDAADLPLPDVSWMDRPIRRESFYAWMKRQPF